MLGNWFKRVELVRGDHIFLTPCKYLFPISYLDDKSEPVSSSNWVLTFFAEVVSRSASLRMSAILFLRSAELRAICVKLIWQLFLEWQKYFFSRKFVLFTGLDFKTDFYADADLPNEAKPMFLIQSFQNWFSKNHQVCLQ